MNNFVENQKIFCVLNKVDKLNRKERGELERKVPDILLEYPGEVDSFSVSAKGTEGVEELEFALAGELSFLV